MKYIQREKGGLNGHCGMQRVRGTGRVAALRLKSFIKIKLKGTKPSKINVKGTLSLNWVLRDIFMKVKLKGTNSFKINVKGILHLKWVVKEHFHKN